jgi:hypothetical protein
MRKSLANDGAELKKGRSSNDLILERVVKKGPYRSQAERWAAIVQWLALCNRRLLNHKKAVREARFTKHTGLSFIDVDQMQVDPAFNNYRMTQTRLDTQTSIMEMQPAITSIMRRLAEKAQAGDLDDKEAKEFIKMFLEAGKTYGLPEVDLSGLRATQEITDEEAVQEGLRIIEELTGKPQVVQKFIKASTNDADTGSSPEVTAIGNDPETPSANIGGDAASVVPPV